MKKTTSYTEFLFSKEDEPSTTKPKDAIKTSGYKSFYGYDQQTVHFDSCRTGNNFLSSRSITYSRAINFNEMHTFKTFAQFVVLNI